MDFSGVGMNAIQARNLVVFGYVPITGIIGGKLSRCHLPVIGEPIMLPDVRFSNRPFGVKRFQTIHQYSVDVAHGLVLLFGIGTRGPSIMGFENEVEQSIGRPYRQYNGRSKRTNELTSSIVPRGTSFHRSVELESSPIACDPIGRPYRQYNGRSKRTNELTSSIVPRGTSFHRSVELESSPIACDPVRFSCCCRGLFPGPAELGAINPYAVHDYGEPACQRHDCLFLPTAPGDLHRPGLEPRPSL